MGNIEMSRYRSREYDPLGNPTQVLPMGWGQADALDPLRQATGRFPPPPREELHPAPPARAGSRPTGASGSVERRPGLPGRAGNGPPVWPMQRGSSVPVPHGNRRSQPCLPNRIPLKRDHFGDGAAGQACTCGASFASTRSTVGGRHPMPTSAAPEIPVLQASRVSTPVLRVWLGFELLEERLGSAKVATARRFRSSRAFLRPGVYRRPSELSTTPRRLLRALRCWGGWNSSGRTRGLERGSYSAVHSRQRAQRRKRCRQAIDDLRLHRLEAEARDDIRDHPQAGWRGRPDFVDEESRLGRAAGSCGCCSVPTDPSDGRTCPRGSKAGEGRQGVPPCSRQPAGYLQRYMRQDRLGPDHLGCWGPTSSLAFP